MIVVTGDAEADPQQLLARGASAVVSKPPDVARLLERVAQLSDAVGSGEAMVAVD